MSEIVQFPKSKESAIEELAIELAAMECKDSVYTAGLLDKCYNLAEKLYEQRTSQRGSLPFSESSFMEQSKDDKPTKKITRKQSKILDIAAETLATTAKDANSLVFMAKPFVQTTLPHRDPGVVHEWIRRNGRLTLSIRPSWEDNSVTGERRCIGVPYGVIPRLLLIWITSDILQKKSRILELGDSLSIFMKKVGMQPRHGGKTGSVTRLKEQFRRLLRCTISIDEIVNKSGLTTNNWLDMQIVSRGSMTWANSNDYHFQSLAKDLEEITSDSWIELSEPFFDMVKDSCVPLDDRILREIKQSPLALDLYAWMIHRTYSDSTVVDISSKRSFVAWYQLHAQFGSNYTRVEDFKRKVKPYLKTIQTMSHNLYLQEAYGGLSISKK